MRDFDHERHCERMAAEGLTSDGYPICRDEPDEEPRGTCDNCGRQGSEVNPVAHVAESAAGETYQCQLCSDVGAIEAGYDHLLPADRLNWATEELIARETAARPGKDFA